MKKKLLLSNCDNLNLEVVIMEPKEEAKAIIQFSHGMAEHKERYYPFMKYLVSHGYICAIHDHRGHGTSIKDPNDLGYFYTKDYNYIVNDLHQVTQYLKETYPDKDIYLFSHSMGTLVSRIYLKKYDIDIKKLVLSGPPTYNKHAHAGLILANVSNIFKGGNYRNELLNKLTFGTYNKDYEKENSWLSTNETEVEKYNTSQYCGYTFTNNGFINLYKLMLQAFKKNYQVNNPNLKIFLIAGSDDPVIQSKEKFNELKEFLSKIGYSNIKSKLYENMRHEILNETNNELVYEDVLNFFNN